MNNKKNAPGSVVVGAGIKRAWCEATIIRADGSVENLGVICDSYSPNVLQRTINRILRRNLTS